ncbi:MAG TPA: RuBisCO large subunit C-terminal-like domain-containing protein [Gemmataceae bacterium]|nr:RuBisCO large subunit C-terminal-like domain-containing protein [Gemmataceae bacterium]
MKPLDSKTLDLLWHDADIREERLREIVRDRLGEKPPPVLDDQIVASYFFAFRTQQLDEAVAEIAYHATSGIRHPPPGSLLEQCTGNAAGIDPFDATGRIGILHMAYPLKMLLQPDGHLTSTDILHTVAGAILFDVYENQDARLLALQIPDRVLRTFPGPAHGAEGVRRITGFGPTEPAFGTILKPTAGIVAEEVGALVEEAASCPLFLFVKEDENLYPNLDYSPAKERTRRAVASIERAKDHRRGKSLIFAPHITGSPHEIMDTVHAVLEAGATGVMFSESFAGGTVRMVRDATKSLSIPPAIYGHNAGIGVKTKAIWREVIDLLARLDGIDFRQTAPVKPGRPFLRPYGLEWEASEETLSRPLPGIQPVMIARAGGLDQGNICMNLADAEQRGLSGNILFLAGSAINSIKNAQGKYDPKLGAEAMQQALEVHRSGELRDVPMERQAAGILAIAVRKNLVALRTALRQRYPELAS